MGKFQNLGRIVHEMEYDALNGEIKRTMRRSARDMIQLGYLLKTMMDKMVWKAYYNCFDEYLESELQMDYTTATRFIRANEKYSIPGNGMEIEEKYREYSQSVLTEMLNMPQELIEKVAPGMTVKQVREIKRQEKQKDKHLRESEDSASGDTVIDGEYREINIPELETAVSEKVATSQSAYGLEKTEYPEGSSLSGEGCGHKYNCFLCAQVCGIRGENRHCRHAPLGNPFNCEMMEILEKGDLERVGDRCQFVNNDLAYHTAGSGEADPCCRECEEICEYRCRRSIQEDETKKQIEAEAFQEEEKLRPDVEAEKNEQAEQPELPAMTNDKSRKAFIDAYEQWPLWIETKETGERYYRYRFPNGTSFVVKTYLCKCFDYKSYAEKLEDRYHDSWRPEEYYIFLEEKHFRDCRTNRSAMAEFLKALQKQGGER